MNRRHFAGATIGAGSLMLASFSLHSTAILAKTTSDDSDSPSSDASGDLVSHIVISLRRTYDRDDPMAFVIATGIEMDRKRYASDMYDNLLTTGIATFEDEGIEFDDEYDYGDLADRGHLYLGVIDLGDEAPPVNVAVLYAQQGKIAYGIAAGNLDDPTSLIDEYTDALFGKGREESDLLLTEDEMPRGFVISEDIDDIVSEDSDSDDPEKDDRKGRTGRTFGKALGAALLRAA